jgi:plastocyanin
LLNGGIELRTKLKVIFTCIVFVLLALTVNAFAGKITGAVKVKGLRTPANVLVYLTKAPAVPLDFSKTKFVMDQRNLEFIPHVLPVLVGATVEFPNNDQVDHNVFSMSRTKKFNLGSYKAGESKTVVFDKPGIVEVRCDVHAEMAAYILVMKNPYFAVTDAKGRFQIPDSGYLRQVGLEGIDDLPAGKYYLKTWHEKLKSQKKSIDVSGNGELQIQVDLKRGIPSVLYK